MNYELLRKLKDASFPQYKSGTERKFYCKHGAYCGSEECYDINDGLVFEPTTDEIIEELGEISIVLSKTVCVVQTLGSPWIKTEGSTIKEALIKLYIEINK